jgi:hypothetical protein
MSGKNSSSANGINLPPAMPMKFYDAWGSQFAYNHMSVAWTWRAARAGNSTVSSTSYPPSSKAPVLTKDDEMKLMQAEHAAADVN